MYHKLTYETLKNALGGLGYGYELDVNKSTVDVMKASGGTMTIQKDSTVVMLNDSSGITKGYIGIKYPDKEGYVSLSSTINGIKSYSSDGEQGMFKLNACAGTTMNNSSTTDISACIIPFKKD